MTKDNLKKVFIIAFLIYTVFSVSFYFLGGDQLKYRSSRGNIAMPEADFATDEIIAGTTLTQPFVNRVEDIDELSVSFAKLYKNAQGKITVYLYNDEEVLMKKTVDLSEMDEKGTVTLVPNQPITGLKGRMLAIKIYASSKADEGVVALASRETPDSRFMFNGEMVEGTLCFSLAGRDENYLGKYYWYIVAATELLLGGLLLRSYSDYRKGYHNLIVRAIAAIYQYEFLISQLVIRDFKSKYKRSILGVFWSFLNPLMTMTVQFLVFSTFFSNDTQNYPIYLLSGVVCFSFFSECTTMCLSSISGNSRLITKV
ncbi:MAG: ABC transporter permease, partial [Erysipelotrichaceae bacterium]|nr:ABC transporter permease [Erysipelotrichaceae bacterium]